MSVEITDHMYFILLMSKQNHLFYVIDLRKQVLIDFIPRSIQITTWKRAPGITMKDAIGINHCDDFEDICVAQLNGLLLI